MQIIIFIARRQYKINQNNYKNTVITSKLNVMLFKHTDKVSLNILDLSEVHQAIGKLIVCWHRSFIKKRAEHYTIRRKCYWQYFDLNAVCERGFIFALQCQDDGPQRSHIIFDCNCTDRFTYCKVYFDNPQYKYKLPSW